MYCIWSIWVCKWKSSRSSKGKLKWSSGSNRFLLNQIHAPWNSDKLVGWGHRSLRLSKMCRHVLAQGKISSLSRKSLRKSRTRSKVLLTLSLQLNSHGFVPNLAISYQLSKGWRSLAKQQQIAQKILCIESPYRISNFLNRCPAKWTSPALS